MARVPLIGPDGAKYSVEATELDQALKMPGFRLADAPSTAEAALRGGAQGATLGWSDEAAGAVQGLRQPEWKTTPGPRALAKIYPGLSYSDAAARWFEENRPDLAAASGAEALRQSQPERYKETRDAQRAANAAAEAAHPDAYGRANVGATLATTIPLGLGGGVPVQALIQGGLGASQASGYSDADTLKGRLADSALGAALGAGSVGVAAGAGRVAQALRARLQAGLAAAEARAATEAAKKPTQLLASEIGSLGGKSQALNRDIEWMIRLLDEEKSGALTPGNRALLESLRKSSVYSDIINKAAQRVAEQAPGAASKVAEQEAIVAGLQSALPQEIARGTAERLAPSASLKRAWTIGKRELSPVIGAYLGNEAAEALGGKDSTAARGLGIIAGGIAGAQYGRGRFGKSLTDLMQMPSTQVILNNIKSGSLAIPETIAKFAPALRAAAMRGSDALAAAHFLLYNNDPEYRTGIDAAGKEP